MTRRITAFHVRRGRGVPPPPAARAVAGLPRPAPLRGSQPPPGPRHAVPYPDHPVAAPPPRWKPRGHPPPYPDRPVPARADPRMAHGIDPGPVAGPKPEEQPFVPVRRFERRAERARAVPDPAGPRRRAVASPSTGGGAARLARRVRVP